MKELPPGRHVRIESLPSDGTLKLNGIAVAKDQIRMVMTMASTAWLGSAPITGEKRWPVS